MVNRSATSGSVIRDADAPPLVKRLLPIAARFLLPMYSVSISSAGIGAHGAYVYGIFASAPSALYIGQTISRYGALGRLAQHVSETTSNTFLQRISAHFEVDRQSLGAIEFLALRLPSSRSFCGRASDYREAVEHLVNYRLIDYVAERSLPIAVISRTKGNPYTAEAVIQDVTDTVAKRLRMWLIGISALNEPSVKHC